MIYNFINAWHDQLVHIGLYRYLQVFQYASFRTLCAIIFCFAFILIFGRRTILWLIKQKIGDNPDFDHADLNQLTKQKSNTPTMGGILISSAILSSTLLLADMTNFYVQAAMVCLVAYTAVGFADDYLKLTAARRGPGSRQGLHSWEKFLFQIGFALILGFFIHYHGSNNPDTQVFNIFNIFFQRTYDPHTFDPETGLQLSNNLIRLGAWAFAILTVIVIAGASNAVNLTDGMDGLASGIMSIIGFAFLLLCLISGSAQWAQNMLVPQVPTSDELAVVCGAIAGACIGFLWFNCHPAQVFMGDTGSLPLGALIGYIAIVIRQELLLFLIGGILVVETLSVILQVGYFKLSGGSRIFRCAPIHHHFHLSGWTEQQVVVRFWLITALLTAIGLASLKLR
ncbi:MAG: phospho-N-acetylmuramoyl-pentapeptide-transferase [Planctomycetes bacterium]|nr:phospho-N-acetylmuramoyl-pentapeptide-transferase [Planctomycetota bacterium]